MALTFGFATVQDVFGKLKRDASALDEEVTADRLFNFVVTGYSMIDWIRNDPSVPKSAKEATAVDGLYNDSWIKVCGDLATAVKHFTLTRRRPITSSTTNKKGYGAGRYGKGLYGVGEETIEVELSDGTTYNCLELVKGVLGSWQDFFSSHGM